MESLGVKQGAGRGALLELWTVSGSLVSGLRPLRGRRWKEKDVEGFSEFYVQKKWEKSPLLLFLLPSGFNGVCKTQHM